LENTFFHKLSSFLWKTIVCIIVALAIYVSFGRFLMSNVSSYGDDILREINYRSPVLIEAEKVSGEWHSFTPEIVLSGLRVTVPGNSEQPLELSEGRIAVDVWATLQAQSLQIFRISLDQLSLQGELTADGKLNIAGMGGSGDGGFLEVFERLLLNIEQINLTRNQLILNFPNTSQRQFNIDLSLRREGSQRRVEAQLLSITTGTEVAVIAEGVGNPFNPGKFSGDLYIDVIDSDLEAMQEVLPRELNYQISGRIALQAWLGWDYGSPSASADIVARDITLEARDKSWKIPVDRISMESALVERASGWRLYASDFSLVQGENEVQLPRLQFDTIGDSLRMRSTGVSIAPLNKLLLSQETTPRGLAEVFSTLDARGELSALQLDITDYKELTSDWAVSANFSNLEVKSWHGAPGVVAESGYAQFEPDGGFIIIDSRQFSMDFPKVFREPLRFDDFYGTINIDWTDTDVTLSSSLVRAEGIEGRASALFGLNIPLEKNDVGLEMDLLVGLENSHPIHRTKYLPYTLSDPLLKWLKSSLGEGRIEQGAFLWRGSLRRQASAMRTVQLFFNVADTNLDYYPGWPPLSELEGTVLINDTQVSVWSDHARLYDSDIRFLSAEAWKSDNAHMMLAISAEMEGDAADGMQVINQSPLNKIVGGVFTDWQLHGGLKTRFELLLDLNDATTAPVVEVDTRWHAVDLGIEPGNLRVDDISGQLAYSSSAGFSSSDLVGSIWGKTLQADVSQSPTIGSTDHSITEPRYDAGSSKTLVAIDTRVDAVDIQQWLDLKVLSLAEGETDVALMVEIAPQRLPRLSIDSDLVGVSLDLPDPWRKSGEITQALDIKLPLGGEVRTLELTLADDLHLQILLSEGGFDGVSLGIQAPPDRLDSGLVYVNGRAALVDEAQWQAFLDQYIYSEFESGAPSGTVEEPAPALAGQSDEAVGEVSAPDIFIDNLRADTLLLYGQQLNDVEFSIEIADGKTRIAGEDDWLRGELVLPDDGTPADLLIEYLGAAGLGELEFGAEGEGGFDIPDMDVRLEEFSYEGHSLGKASFAIRREGPLLRVEDIVGTLAGLSLTAGQPGQLVWSTDNGSSKTQFDGQLVFKDLGQTLEQLTYQTVIETSSGELDVDLDWPGGPQDFSLDTVRGSLGIDIEQGRFLSAPTGASGALRVVGVLNMADIVERLSLDLSNMFDSGIPFHSVNGEVFFHGGTIEMASMDVKGRSSGFQFSGISDVGKRTLDGEMIATLPVANNLPWVAALAAGPAVAAGVFVVSKVFEDQVNRFSSAVYTIEGSWDDPDVEFDRIFDTSSEHKVIMPDRDGADRKSVEEDSVVDNSVAGESVETLSPEADVDESEPVAEAPPAKP